MGMRVIKLCVTRVLRRLEIAVKTVLHGIKIFQNKCIRVLRNADFYAHVSPLAKSTNIILFDDLHKHCVLNLMCKIHLKLCCVTLSDMFKKINVSHNYCSRNACNKFYIQPCRTNVRKLFISNYDAVVWNNLNDAMFTCTLKSFKLLSKSNILSSYNKFYLGIFVNCVIFITMLRFLK